MLQTADSRNPEGNTPLHWACLNGCIQVAKLLLDAGANPATLNRYSIAAQLSHQHHYCFAKHNKLIFVLQCSHSNTPVDDALGKPYQDDMLALISSYQTSKDTGNGDAKSQDDADSDGEEDGKGQPEMAAS